MAALIAPPRQPSGWERIINGDDDHIRGYDDDVVLKSDKSERPDGYFADSVSDGLTEPERAALQEVF